MFFPPRSKRTSIIFLTLGALLFVGCTNLDEVARFSSLADSASSSLTEIIGDFKGTCLRSNALAPRDAGGNSTHQRDCAIYDTITPDLQSAQDVLTDYLKALGKLAADNDPGYSKSLDALGGQFQDAGLAKDQTDAAKAASSLAKKVADAALNGYRRKEISKLVSTSNDDVQTLTHALSDIVARDYAIMLSNEAGDLRDYYQTPIMNDQGKNPLAVILIRKQWDEESSALQKRIDGANAYGKLMKSIADANQKITDQKNKIGSKDLIKIIGPDLSDMSQALSTLRQSFK